MKSFKSLLVFFSLCNAVSLLADVDQQMREAYARWYKIFREVNIETTPAYDVVGLAAAIGRTDLFREKEIDSESKDLELKKAKKIVLKNRDSAQLDLIFSNLDKYKESLPDNLLIVTDFGEECDDEVTALLANRLRKLGVNVTLLFTTKHFENQRARFNSWSQSLKKNSFSKAQVHSLDSFPVNLLKKVFPGKGKRKSGKPTKNVILQIGPIHANSKAGKTVLAKLKNKKSLASISYDFFLLGEFSKTLNSQKDGEEATKLFSQYAQRTVIVDTERGNGAFKFTHNSLASLFGADHPILSHVSKIGWRNTVGRANPFAGKFVAHLVAKKSNGANYQTVAGLVKQLEDKNVKASYKESTDMKKAESLAKEYLDRLQKTAPEKLPFLRLALTGDETNSIAGAKASEILEGYIFILTQMKAYFGVPIEFFESGSPENWKEQWNYPSKDQRERAKAKKVLFQITLPVPSYENKGGGSK